MMDRKTIIVVVSCLLALIASQALINKLYPPKPKAPRPIAAASSNAVPEQAQTPKPAEPLVNAAQATNAESTPPRTTEQIVTLSNEFIRVDFTSWGGGVRSVELLKHKAFGDGPATLNGAGQAPALSLVGVPGAGSNDTYSIQIQSTNTVVLRSGNGVTKTFMLSNDYLVAASVQIPSALAPSTPVGLVVGTAEPMQTHELPNYLVVDWEGASKFRNRTLPRVMDRVKKGDPHEAILAHWVAVKSQYFTMIVSTTSNITGVTCGYVDLATPPPPPTNHGVTATADIPLA